MVLCTPEKKQPSNVKYYLFYLANKMYKGNQTLQDETEKASTVNFLSTLGATLCPMNEGRNLRLPHIAVEKNNPGVSSSEEKSSVRTFRSTDVFTLRKRYKAAVALILYCNVFIFQLWQKKHYCRINNYQSHNLVISLSISFELFCNLDLYFFKEQRNPIS